MPIDSCVIEHVLLIVLTGSHLFSWAAMLSFEAVEEHADDSKVQSKVSMQPYECGLPKSRESGTKTDATNFATDLVKQVMVRSSGKMHSLARRH